LAQIVVAILTVKVATLLELHDNEADNKQDELPSHLDMSEILGLLDTGEISYFIGYDVTSVVPL
jgi:hypothetical protein